MLNSWRICVEETKLVAEKHPDIFVLINDDGKKLYVRTRLDKDLKDAIDLDILTREELLALGIQIEESLLSEEQGFDKEIEESESEPEENKHVPKKYNANDPKDMEEAKRIADERLKYLQSNDPNYLKKQLEEKAEEAEDYKAKLEMIAANQLEKKMDALGIHDDSIRTKIREDPNLITGYEMALPRKHAPAPSGSAPLNSQQIGNSNPQGFDSVKEMIEALYDEHTPENEAILKELWRKSLHGIRSGKMDLEQYPQEPLVEKHGEEVTKLIDKNFKSSGPSEIEKFTKRKKKKADQ